MGYDGCDIIQEANTILPIFHDGGYGSEIHEMSEMAINCWGQWELDNQPVWILQHMQVCAHLCCLGWRTLCSASGVESRLAS